MIVPSTKHVVMQRGYKMIAFPQLCDLVCYTARLPMLGQLLTLGGLILLTRRHETLHCIKTQLPAKNAHNMSLPPLLTYSQLIRRRLPQCLLFCQAKIVWFGLERSKFLRLSLLQNSKVDFSKWKTTWSAITWFKHGQNKGKRAAIEARCRF